MIVNEVQQYIKKENKEIPLEAEGNVRRCDVCSKGVYYFKKNDNPNHNLYKCYHCKQWVTTTESPRDNVYWPNDRKKKTHIDVMDLISKKQLLDKLSTMKDCKNIMKYKALISFLYLTASRVEEVVGLVNQHTRDMIVEPLRISQVSFETEGGQDFMVIKNIPSLKRKINKKDAFGNDQGLIPRRTVGVLIKDERELVKYIQDYLLLVEEKNTGLPLFKMSYQWAWAISSRIAINEEKNAFNHYWRHLRLSHLAEHYGFTDMQLQQYVGWANTNMASKYVHLDWRSLGRTMASHSLEEKKNESNN